MATAPSTGTTFNNDGPEAPEARPDANESANGNGRASPSRNAEAEAIDRRTREIGRELLERMGRGGPWRRSWWDDRFMAATLDDPTTRVQLFRFIDVLPALKDDGAARNRLAEFLGEAGARAPWWLALAPRLAPEGTGRAEWLGEAARAVSAAMARKFIAGANPEEALRTVLRLRKRKLAFSADLLGEAVISEAEADWYQQTCLDLMRSLAGPLRAAPEVPIIDRDQDGPIPRVNLSLKLSSLTAHFEPIHAETSIERAAERLRPILRAARELGAYVHVDMEQYAYRSLTYDLFRQVLMEQEFRDWPDVGIVVQAYHDQAEAELNMLWEWSRARGAPISVRLVKGAYWDYEVLTARRLGWPEPVYLEKWRSDAMYERCSLFLLKHHEQLRPAFGSHNARSLAHAIAGAEVLGLPPAAFELQTLFGMGDAIEHALVERGHRVRVYTPYGALLPGMAYLVRRLLENTSNESFLKRSSTPRAQIDDLLRNPEEIGAMRPETQTTTVPPHPNGAASGFGDGPARNFGDGPARNFGDGAAPSLPPFRNEPTTDFARAENRAAMRRALEEVGRRFGEHCPLVIGGAAVETGAARLSSPNPSQSARAVCTTASASAEHAARAVAAARAALPGWSSTPAAERAAVLVRTAAIFRRDRFELAALEIYECGKPWAEADADVAEAIDFCEFYAREMVRLDAPRRRDVPGETNHTEHLPRGVAAIIPPWNFPLAIPTGMTVAALVTGNTAVLKPAEQAPWITWRLFQALNEAGLPPGALNYLPGLGEEAGAALVEHPDVAVIAFTGSREVGLLINRQAAEPRPGQHHVKRAIAEMGGKNAIIIDNDADLDEAVLGVVQSAFGYAGQKCSACSRVIVLAGVYDAFLARLVEAARAVKVGPADDPETIIGPLIDADARRRVLDYQKLAANEGRVVFQGSAGTRPEEGFFVGPTIVDDVAPGSRLAQEEIFGPVLAVLKAEDLDDALKIANGTPYALTGGLYSRGPSHIEKVRREFRVGNLYINRAITGALVDRQPFGGFKLSGVGAKAGGPDYLHEFLLTRCITENTMRRGFAPEEEGPGEGR